MEWIYEPRRRSPRCHRMVPGVRFPEFGDKWIPLSAILAEDADYRLMAWIGEFYRWNSSREEVRVAIEEIKEFLSLMNG